MTKANTGSALYVLARIELTAVGDMMHPQMPTTIYINADHIKTYPGSEYVFYKLMIDDDSIQTLAKVHILKLIVAATKESFDFGNSQKSALAVRAQNTDTNESVDSPFLNKELEEINKIASSAIGSPYMGIIGDIEDTAEIDLTDMEPIIELGPRKKIELAPIVEKPKIIRMVIGTNKANKAEDVNAQAE